MPSPPWVWWPRPTALLLPLVVGLHQLHGAGTRAYLQARSWRRVHFFLREPLSSSLASLGYLFARRRCPLATHRCRSRAARNRQTVLLPLLRPCGRPAVVSCDRACSVLLQSGSGPQNEIKCYSEGLCRQCLCQDQLELGIERASEDCRTLRCWAMHLHVLFIPVCRTTAEKLATSSHPVCNAYFQSIAGCRGTALVLLQRFRNP